jgi:glycosyltransferase involved in cell wall biosynthesis
VKIKPLAVQLGPAEARNAGVGEARSQWVAFLDHDDEWFPEKLQTQLQMARQSPHRYPIIGCRLIVRSEVADVVWPKRFPKPNEPMSEYLFCRTHLFAGEGFMQSSIIFTAKELLQKVPFRAESHRHDDLDWLLRATMLDGVGVQFVPSPEPLAIWHREENLNSVSSRTDWRFSLAWINQNKHLVTPHAYASFLMTWLSANAVRERDRKAFLPLLREACQYGRPTALDVLLYLGIWLMPQRARNRIRVGFQKRDRQWLC